MPKSAKAEPIHTRDELAHLADVGHTLYHQAKTILDSNNEDIIETNLRQRGIGNTNPIKLGRCLVELERIYGIKHGGNRLTSCQTDNLKSQSDIRNDLNISQKTYADYKRLTTLIPEFQDMVSDGKVKLILRK